MYDKLLNSFLNNEKNIMGLSQLAFSRHLQSNLWGSITKDFKDLKNFYKKLARSQTGLTDFFVQVV